MPTLNLKDPEVYRLARELAQRRGTSMTAAVRAALAEAVEREPARAPRADLEQLLAIARRSAARPEPYLTDDDLYDERGLPR
ncbi:MAG: type II toxin-antitoxin system VapB family antitoxin [Nocardioides sp.]|uniref:type II toxin-antitoxin system VapB family antitoxin n=1 Tax=Nocardioides sp. TaxID=35761 RepID=UPI00260DD56C|nr:type II toxin-antitoxin system VapB family antitoxin [Nocardioides sp.]